MWGHRYQAKPSVSLPLTPDVHQARQAQQAASAKFLEAVERGPEVRRLSSELHDLRVRNHFGELIDRSMGK